MDNAEDVERLLIIIKRKLVQVVDFQQQPWEDSMVGVINSELEEERELAEWDIKKIFPEELKMVLEVELPPSQSKERLNDLIF